MSQSDLLVPLSRRRWAGRVAGSCSSSFYRRVVGQGPEYAPAPPSNGPAVKGLRAPQGVPPSVAPRRLGNCAKLDVTVGSEVDRL